VGLDRAAFEFIFKSSDSLANIYWFSPFIVLFLPNPAIKRLS
jgi:hypothetical protein